MSGKICTLSSKYSIMFSDFFITFRESLEAALIIGVILSYLSKIGQKKQNKLVYWGIFAGITASLIGAFLFNKLAGGFEGKSEVIFEGTTMLIGSFLLVTMIIWMMKQKNIAKNLEKQVGDNLNSTKKFGLFFLVFVSILREGVEIVIFLGAATFASKGISILGSILGIITAIILGYAIFAGSAKINIKKFFNIIGAILVIFAIWLAAHGVAEFAELAEDPAIITVTS